MILRVTVVRAAIVVIDGGFTAVVLDDVA